MKRERFWQKYWDEGVADIDPALFETAYTDLIRPVFKKFPDKTACAYFGRHVSYTELDREANRFAHMLLAQGFHRRHDHH